MKKYILPLILGITTLFLVISLLMFDSSVFRFCTSIIFLIVHAYSIGILLYPKQTLSTQNILGFLHTILLLTLYGAILYYLFNLTRPYIVLSVLLTSLTVLLLWFIYKPCTNLKQRFTDIFTSFQNKKYSIYHIIILILLGIFTYLTVTQIQILLSIQITEALRSPWKVIPKEFIYVYVINTFVLIVLHLYNRLRIVNYLCTIIHSFISIGIALLAYKIGYGFDPFIHRTTVSVIFEQGEILPKPFYYIGQYALIVILSHLTTIHTSLIDLFLVPTLFSVIVPLAIFTGTKSYFKTTKSISSMLSLGGLFLPLTILITTTPQAFANTLIVIFIFLTLHCLYAREKNEVTTVQFILMQGLFTASILLIHPLAGLPAAIFSGFAILKVISPQNTLQKVLFYSTYSIYFVVSTILLPLTFIINNYVHGKDLTHAFKNIYEIKDSLWPLLNPYEIYFTNRYNLIGDIAYFFVHNSPYIFIGLSLIVLIYLIHKSLYNKFHIFYITFISLFINYFLLKSVISFDMLIEYERSDFPARILLISLFFLLPIILYGINYTLHYIRKYKQFQLLALLIFVITTVITGNMYTAYPREDGYVYNTGYNISQADITAVHYIERDAFITKNEDYLVLANQTVSVAALQEFGFKKYFKTDTQGELFYYPIPTSAPTYQFYLDMVYKMPSQHIINDAANLVGVETVYFVINKYWARSREIITAAKKQADHWSALDDGQVYVFRYSVKDNLSPDLNQLPVGIQIKK